jgi:PmbA protein
VEHLLVEEIISSARKVAEQAEVFWVSSQETPVHFEANKLKQVQTKESSSVALRIIKEGKVGFSAASGPGGAGKNGSLSPNLSLRERGISRDLIDMAVETSLFGNPARFELPSSRNYPEMSIFDPQIEKMAIEKMIELGNELVAKVREHTPDILCDVEVTKGTSSIQIINSQGGEASYDKSFFSLGLEGVLIQDTDMLFVGESESSCRLLDKVELVADRVVGQLELAKRKATVFTKPLPVIFTPHGVASAFLSPIALASNGKTVLEGGSPLKERLGELVFDTELTLWDDATLDYCLGSSPCDDEGMPSERLSLIRSGVVSHFFYDLQTAASAGVRSTGSGRRAGGTGQVQPAISSLVIEEGDIPFQSMVEDMKEGLIVEQLIGADQGNLLGGDFGGNVLLGYKVENRRIIGRVKDTMISGNIYQVLKEHLGIGCEARWVNGVLWAPYLYCPRLAVSAR